MESKNIATNKKAFRNYFVVDRYECGIELKGSEVKSVRAGHVHFRDSFARIEKKEILLHSLHIDPYAQASYLNPDSDRARKLLLHKNEIKKILGQMIQKGLTLVPLSIFLNKHNFVKVSLGLVKGKKLYDKRETIKKRDIKKDLDRAVRTSRK
ncbi:MAG: SsrA-binding protein SmpB [Candidatus Aceula meridiana]|nr:SsrA-binding protein SmpB [Candidatus Aceula meridiana]